MSGFDEAIRRQDARNAQATSAAAERQEAVRRAVPVIQQGFRDLARYLTSHNRPTRTYRHIKKRREWLGSTYYPQSPPGYVVYASSFTASRPSSRPEVEQQFYNLTLLLPDGRLWNHSTGPIRQGFVDFNRFNVDVNGMLLVRFYDWPNIDGRSTFRIDDAGNIDLYDPDYADTPFHDYLADIARRLG